MTHDGSAWPEHLAQIWGPGIEGMQARMQFHKAQLDRYAEAKAWREAGEPLLPVGMTVAQWRALGSPDQIDGVPVIRRIERQARDPVAALLAVNGVTARERVTTILPRPEQEAGDE
jgi:hypothetical protein